MNENIVREEMKKAYKHFLLSFPKGKVRNNRCALSVHTSYSSDYYWIQYCGYTALIGRVNKKTGEVTEVCGASDGPWEVTLLPTEIQEIDKECEVVYTE